MVRRWHVGAGVHRACGTGQLGLRLHKIGIRPQQDRSTAPFIPAAGLPAAIHARILGVHIQIATLLRRNAVIPPVKVEDRAVWVGATIGIGWAHCGTTADDVLMSAVERTPTPPPTQ